LNIKILKYQNKEIEEIIMLEKIKKIIAEQLSVEENEIKAETSLTKDLEADSLDFVELVMSLEETFDIKIEDDDAAGIGTVQDIIDYLKAQGIEE
jgi:acyl carrier protein